MAKQPPFYTEPGDITVQVGAGVLIHRCGYLVVRDNKLLMLYVPDEDLYFVPGGRVSCGSCSQSTVVREVEEETGLVISEKDAEVAALVEYFFTSERSQNKYHEIAVYYRVNLPEGADVPSHEQDGAGFPFVWVPLNALAKHNVKPAFLASQMDALSSGFHHLIHYEEGYSVDHSLATAC